MSDRLLPNAGFHNKWTVGSSGWGTDTDANWQLVDTLLHAAVLNNTTTAPPSSPSQGDRYLIPTGATGAWASNVGTIAVYIDGAWTYYTPKAGWKVYDIANSTTYTYTGTAWTASNAGTVLVQSGTTVVSAATLEAGTGISLSVSGGVLTVANTETASSGGAGTLVVGNGTTAVAAGTLMAGSGVQITFSGSVATIGAMEEASLIYQLGTGETTFNTLEVGTGLSANVVGSVLTVTNTQTSTAALVYQVGTATTAIGTIEAGSNATLSVSGNVLTINGSAPTPLPVYNVGTVSNSFGTVAAGTNISLAVSGGVLTITNTGTSGGSSLAVELGGTVESVGTINFGSNLTGAVSSGTLTINASASGASYVAGHTRPSLSSFTWLNQGSATATDNNNGPLTIQSATTTTDNLRYLLQPTPNANTSAWTLTAQLRALKHLVNYVPYGLCLYDSSSGKIITFSVQETNNGSGATPYCYVNVNEWTNSTTYSAALKSYNMQVFDPVWMRIYCDGTNFNFQLSSDGFDYETIATLAIAGFGSPDHVGFGMDFIDTSSIGFSPQVKLIDWYLQSGAASVSPTTYLIGAGSPVGATLEANGTLISAGTLNFGTGLGVSVTGSIATVSTVGQQPFDVLMFNPGTLSNSQKLIRAVMARQVVFPAAFSGSYVNAGTTATAANTLSIANGATTVGTISIAAGSATGTITAASATTIAAGGTLLVTNQATADASLADLSIVLTGVR